MDKNANILAVDNHGWTAIDYGKKIWKIINVYIKFIYLAAHYNRTKIVSYLKTFVVRK
jgi:hypothetical protein